QQTEDWLSTVDPGILLTLPESEVHRQTIIYKTITQEEQYVQDLDTVEALFIRPLLKASPPVMPAHKLDEFVEEVFGNILDLRECNRRLVEAMYVRQRGQAPIIQRIGDVFFDAAREFRFAYPTYLTLVDLPPLLQIQLQGRFLDTTDPVKRARPKEVQAELNTRRERMRLLTQDEHAPFPTSLKNTLDFLSKQETLILPDVDEELVAKISSEQNIIEAEIVELMVTISKPNEDLENI
ncbi:Dbl homology domain-containing protein, partial [Suillus hirtellus]